MFQRNLKLLVWSHSREKLLLFDEHIIWFQWKTIYVMQRYVDLAITTKLHNLSL